MFFLYSFPTRRSSDLYLIEQGHREVVHVRGPQDWFDAQERYLGWRAELEDAGLAVPAPIDADWSDRKSTRLNSSHVKNSYAVFCLKKKKIRGTIRNCC